MVAIKQWESCQWEKLGHKTNWIVGTGGRYCRRDIENVRDRVRSCQFAAWRMDCSRVGWEMHDQSDLGAEGCRLG